MKIDKTPGGIYQEVQKDIDYKTAQGFVKKWTESTDFVEGKQWPPPTEKTKYMPRPVINICDQTVENKRSNILSQELKMRFRPKEMIDDSEDDNKIAQDFTDMAENTWEDLNQARLNEEMTNDAIIVGSGIIHYYYDANYTAGVQLPHVGRICGEIIDPMDIVLGNNQLKAYELQKQPFIILRKREDFKDVQEESKEYGDDWDKIQPDKEADEDEKYRNAKTQSENSREVTTFTKYYIEKGELNWVKVTKDAVVRKPKKFAPVVKLEDGTVQYEPFKLYPLVMTVFKRNKKCTYGRGFIQDIIPNQKALNWNLGMMLLSVQDNAWPKLLVQHGALEQQITNVPGEVLTVKSMNGADGVKYLQPPNFSQAPMQLAQNMLEMTRSVVGVTETSTGEQLGANMSAAAIIALQNQAQKPNDAYMKDIVQTMKDVGKIWEGFYKSFYNLPRPIKGKDEQGNPITKVFNGEDGRGMEFDLIVDVGPASVYSESLVVNMLDSYAQRQWIDKYQHAEYMPDSVMPQGLKEQFKKEQETIKEQQEAQQQATEALSPEEQAHLQQNPQIMQQAMQEVGGGANGQMPAMPRQING